MTGSTNVSFTYDSALATFAFLSAGAKTQSEQLLDQLKALQRTDGSIEYSFNVRPARARRSVRAGAMAWVGYAALAYREIYNSTKYDTRDRRRRALPADAAQRAPA